MHSFLYISLARIHDVLYLFVIHLISISWSMWVLKFDDLYTISKIVDRKHAHTSAIKSILLSICVWTYAYSLSSLFKFLELKLLLHQIPHFMQSRPLYVLYAHARNCIFIEKSVRSCTTKDTVYLIHIESNMGTLVRSFSY